MKGILLTIGGFAMVLGGVWLMGGAVGLKIAIGLAIIMYGSGVCINGYNAYRS